MVRDNPVGMDELSMELYAWYFFKVRAGPEDSENSPAHILISSEFELKQAAERQFWWVYGEKGFEKRFQRWWSGYLHQARRKNFGPILKKTDTGYLIKLIVLRKIRYQIIGTIPLEKGIPILQEFSYEITSRGEIKVTQPVSIYPKD